MKKQKLIILIFIILILNSLSFSAAAVNYGGILKIRDNLMPLTLNPIYAENETALKINKQIFEGLITYDKNGSLKPQLVQSWEIKDEGKSFIFNLRDDIYFHSLTKEEVESENKGRKVKAEDWKNSFEYLADPDNKSPYADLLEKVEGYDSYRSKNKSEISGIKVLAPFILKIELTEACFPFIYNFLEPALVVMPSEDFNSETRNFALNPVGTGAFYLKKFKDNSIILEKNNNYWQNDEQGNQLPYLQQIDINFNSNQKITEKNLQSYDLYQLNQEEYLSFREIKNRTSYKMKKIPQNSFYFYGFNYNSNYFKNADNSNLRKALNKGLNKEKVIEELNLNNYAALSDSKNNFILFRKSSNLYNYTETQAKNLLDNFDVQVFSLNLSLNNKKENLEIAEIIKEEFNNFGIELKLDIKNWTQYLTELKNYVLDSELLLQSYQYQNKYDFLYDNFYSESEKNYSNFENERIDNLLDYLKFENNKSNQNRAYELIEKILAEEYPAVFLFQKAESYLISERLKNIDILNNIYQKNELKLLYLN